MTDWWIVFWKSNLNGHLKNNRQQLYITAGGGCSFGSDIFKISFAVFHCVQIQPF